MTFVPLDRRFIGWGASDLLASELSALALSSFGDLDWAKLLERRRIVILAEAGSGKSRELEEQALLQAQAGRQAFYATVQNVAHEGLRSALGISQHADLDAWEASDAPAWFFIDSVDEAKLDHIRLETALRRLADGRGDRLGRAHVVLSGRYSDWEFRADLARFRTGLPVPSSRTDSDLTAPADALIQILNDERPKPSKPLRKSIG
ncbi:MAG: hypothetical protein ACYC5H_04960 [Methylovirgula sp.]